MYGIGNDPFGGQQRNDAGDRLVDRIMAAQYNLAVERNEEPQARGILAQMLGFWLQNRASR